MESERKYNRAYVVTMGITYAISGLVYGYFFAILNSTYRILEKVNGWGEKDVTREAIAVSLTPAGAILGCIFSGPFMGLGRKNLMLLVNCVIIAGVALTLFKDYYIFIVGRALGGVAIGVHTIVGPLSLREISPVEISGMIGIFFPLGVRVGNLMAYGMGYFLEDVSNPDRFRDILWCKSVLGIPLIMVAVQSTFLLLYFRYDTPKSCMLRGDREQCLMILGRLFPDKRRVQQEIEGIEKVLVETKGKDVTFRELFSIYFRYALFFSFGFKMLQVMTGYNAIILFSTSIFGRDDPARAKFATIIIGVVNLCAVFICSFIIDRAGRKIILLFGLTGLIITNTVTGFGGQYGIQLMMEVGIISFIVCYSLSFGPIGWILISEILPPKGVSIIFTLEWVAITSLSFAFHYVIESLGEQGTFWGFAGMNLLGLIYMILLLKETKGKSEMENRLLYSPKEVREKRLMLVRNREASKAFGDESLKLNASIKP